MAEELDEWASDEVGDGTGARQRDVEQRERGTAGRTGAAARQRDVEQGEREEQREELEQQHGSAM